MTLPSRLTRAYACRGVLPGSILNLLKHLHFQVVNSSQPGHNIIPRPIKGEEILYILVFM
jgi:hypothetical protein